MCFESLSFLSFFLHNQINANDVQWSSFGTLALTLSDSERYGYRRDIRSDNGVYSGDIDLEEFSLIGGS